MAILVAFDQALVRETGDEGQGPARVSGKLLFAAGLPAYFRAREKCPWAAFEEVQDLVFFVTDEHTGTIEHEAGVKVNCFQLRTRPAFWIIPRHMMKPRQRATME